MTLYEICPECAGRRIITADGLAHSCGSCRAGFVEHVCTDKAGCECWRAGFDSGLEATREPLGVRA